jgi:hypothetical protein
MKAKLLLRIAVGCLVFHLIGHTIGMLTWKQTDDPVKSKVISEMDSHKFEFMGAMKSLGENYAGMNILFEITLAMLSVVLWNISGMTQDLKHSGKILLPIGLSLLAFSVTEFTTFFALAGATSLLAGVFTTWASIRLKST